MGPHGAAWCKLLARGRMPHGPTCHMGRMGPHGDGPTWPQCKGLSHRQPTVHPISCKRPKAGHGALCEYEHADGGKKLKDGHTTIRDKG
jgi:hypothetical protein